MAALVQAGPRAPNLQSRVLCRGPPRHSTNHLVRPLLRPCPIASPSTPSLRLPCGIRGGVVADHTHLTHGGSEAEVRLHIEQRWAAWLVLHPPAPCRSGRPVLSGAPHLRVRDSRGGPCQGVASQDSGGRGLPPLGHRHKTEGEGAGHNRTMQRPTEPGLFHGVGYSFSGVCLLHSPSATSD